MLNLDTILPGRRWRRAHGGCDRAWKIAQNDAGQPNQG